MREVDGASGSMGDRADQSRARLVNGVRRQLGCGWRTVWDAIKPLLQAAAQDPARFEEVTRPQGGEHIRHHVSTKPIEDGGRGPKELTEIVDVSLHPDSAGELRVRARLLDLVPDRSALTYCRWLSDRGDLFRAQVEVATLDPFHGHKNTIDDQHEDARSILDAFHVVKLASATSWLIGVPLAGPRIALAYVTAFLGCHTPGRRVQSESFRRM
ncbi:transposase [Schaalia sp. 19OD2882]|uniref:transposase n=1 Tax=Schaalia sp. 19OD2882 TaxID=2794089 RepID=UPI001C1F1820|nr:transposase [Schaalia sp. 19OD2882]QWW19539.1 transposase [Schaalia sp. 19OD2882]